MPGAIALGISYSDFWHMTPKILHAVQKGHEQKLKIIDSYIHEVFGYYGISALMFSLDNAFNGRKASSEYAKIPILGDHYIVDHEYTQEEFEKLSKEERQDILMRGFGLDRKEKGENNG